MAYLKKQIGESIYFQKHLVELPNNWVVWVDGSVEIEYGMASTDYDVPNDPDDYKVDITKMEFYNEEGEYILPSKHKIREFKEWISDSVIDHYSDEFYI